MGTSKNYHLQIFNAENAKNTQRSQRILKFLEVPLYILLDYSAPIYKIILYNETRRFENDFLPNIKNKV